MTRRTRRQVGFSTWTMFLLLAMEVVVLIVATMTAQIVNGQEYLEQNPAIKKLMLNQIKTCNTFWLSVRSLWMWNNYLDALIIQENNTKLIHYRYCPEDPANIPIYHINFRDQSNGGGGQFNQERCANRQSHLQNKYSLNRNKELWNNYFSKHPIVSFIQFDHVTSLFVLEKKNYNLLLLIESFNTKGLVVGESEIEKGSIPLLHYIDLKKKNLFLKHPVHMINKIDYTYQNGYIRVQNEPMEYQEYTAEANFIMENKLYFGFNSAMDTMYFGKSLEKMKNTLYSYLPASDVLVDQSWHPFLCYDYIYICMDNLVIIVPFFDLNNEISELEEAESSIPIFMVSIKVISHAKLFRCVRSRSGNWIDKELKYPNKSIETFFDWLKLLKIFLTILVTSGIVAAIVYYYKKRNILEEHPVASRIDFDVKQISGNTTDATTTDADITKRLFDKSKLNNTKTTISTNTVKSNKSFRRPRQTKSQKQLRRGLGHNNAISKANRRHSSQNRLGPIKLYKSPNKISHINRGPRSQNRLDLGKFSKSLDSFSKVNSRLGSLSKPMRSSSSVARTSQMSKVGFGGAAPSHIEAGLSKIKQSVSYFLKTIQEMDDLKSSKIISSKISSNIKTIDLEEEFDALPPRENVLPGYIKGMLDGELLKHVNYAADKHKRKLERQKERLLSKQKNTKQKIKQKKDPKVKGKTPKQWMDWTLDRVFD